MKPNYFIYVVGLMIFASSCKDDILNNNSSNRFSAHLSSTVIFTPPEVELNSMYTKYINSTGIPVIGTEETADEALIIGDSIIAFMLIGMDDVKSELAKRGEYYIIRPDDVAIQSLPEFVKSNSFPSQGEYSIQNRVASTVVSDILCDFPDTALTGLQDNAFVHEVAHMIQLGGLDNVKSDFVSKHNEAFSNAVSKGLWVNTYSLTDKREYFAELVQIWYEVQWPFGPPSGDGTSNDINTRYKLQLYDTMGYNLVASYFNARFDIPACNQ